MVYLSGFPSRTSVAKMISMVAVLLIGALVLSACSTNQQGTEPPMTSRTFNPKVLTEFQLDEWAWTERPDQLISPDGKYALLVLNGEATQTMAAVPLQSEEHTPVAFYSAPSGWTEQGALVYRTLGWSAAGTPLFVASGFQNQGPNVGKRGVALLSGDLQAGTAKELAFIDLPQGELHTATYFQEQDKVFFTVSGAIWSYDMGDAKLNQVKVDLPTYDGLFTPRLSADGKYFAYELVGEGKSGIYLLDALTGSEKALLSNGDTMSFIPQWSPDGKYLAVYTVDRKVGATGTSYQDYDYFPGEDGPLTISPRIVVIDTSGKVVRTVSLEGKILSNFRWSNDSKSLGFVTGAATSPDTAAYLDMGIPKIPWDGLWTVSVAQGEPVRLASLESSLSEEPAFIYPLAFDAKSEGLYYQFSQAEELSVWYAIPGNGADSVTPLTPIKIAEGYWQFQNSNPIFGEYTGALITSGATTDVWFLGAELKKTDGWSTLTTIMLGYNDDTIVLFRRGEDKPATITVVSVYDE